MIPDNFPNAFATGRDPQHATIALTTGLIESLENDNISLATPSEKEQVQTKPAAEIKASSPASVTSGETIYVVKKNESLSMIAQKILGDASKYVQIAKDNNIDNPDIIEEGTELKINH